MQLNRTDAHVLLPGLVIVMTIQDNAAGHGQLKRSMSLPVQAVEQRIEKTEETNFLNVQLMKSATAWSRCSCWLRCSQCLPSARKYAHTQLQQRNERQQSKEVSSHSFKVQRYHMVEIASTSGFVTALLCTCPVRYLKPTPGRIGRGIDDNLFPR